MYKRNLIIVLLIGLATGHVFAQGNDNPTGVAGEFNGSVTTGCHYDPYTGNAKRSVTDLVVAGGIGAYPLEFTRTSNSRGIVGDTASEGGQTGDFGAAGAWLHSYQWSIDPKLQYNGARPPSKAVVNYPDGRTVIFYPSTNGDPYYRGRQGVRDRLQFVWDSNTAGRAYLIMPDGGKVWFSIAITSTRGCGSSSCISYTYTLQGIIDPYGQTTTVTGSPQSGLVTITEPGGRWLKLYYTQLSGNHSSYIITSLTASDGRSIQYTYNYDPPITIAWLTQVTYFNDPNLVATYTYQPDNTSGTGVPLLLSTCIDPMYSGPMWKIGYKYTGSIYGQIFSENYWDGVNNIGAAVSTLTNIGTETRGDGKTRTFRYGTPPFLTGWTDFKGHSGSLAYDSNNYVNAITDLNGHTTNLTNNAFTGAVLTQTFPSTPGDTPPNTPRGVVTTTYGSAACADPNNRDSNNPYYVCTTTDEGGNVTTYSRDTTKRLTQTNYPDGGSELFQYNSFGEMTSHTTRTSGVETFEYDSRGLRQKYRDAYHASGNPTFWYQYDSLDRLSGSTDALGSGPGDINHTTNYAYNSRGETAVTTLPVDPVDGQRHTITKGYNLADGTVSSVTDQLNHQTSFGYDDYKRLRTTTTPPRFAGDTINHTSTVYYDATGTGNDYTYTDASPTWIVSRSGKMVANVYDENRRKSSTTVGACASGQGGGGGVGFGSPTPTPPPPPCPDAATTTFVYDPNGNLTSVVDPKEQPGQQFAGQSTTTAYDERNRQMSVVDALNDPPTTFKYDAAGHKASVTRPNGQLITYDSYDAMNRLLQQTMKQTPDPDAVTKYTYYTSGLLHTMQDPHLVANGSSETYTYQYDSIGRKTSLAYPRPAPSATPTSELWHYDTAGRIDTFTNRNGNTQRTLYDNLNRAYNISWDDSGLTPTVALSYDAVSRVTSINNANANISHAYYDDNLLKSETSTITGDGVARTVKYAYDADGNRGGTDDAGNVYGILYPNSAYTFNYDYTNRSQLWHIFSGSTTMATFAYDPDGNVTSRAPNNSTSSSFIYDGLDRLTHIAHALNGTTRTFDYAYDSVSNRKWVKRDGGTGDVFGYDLNNQSISVLLNIANPDTTAPGNQTINYDANGNRTTFSPYASTDTYTTNNLNQYTQRNSASASYDAKGNMLTGLDNSGYTYDAQSRILTASKSGTLDTFKYDGLNRQVSRQIGVAPVVYNVYDGWNLIGEYAAGATLPTVAYLDGVKNLSANLYYYQDASGSTSHLADTTGHLLEWYRYDLQGTPFINGDQNNHVSAYGVRHLFTGQQWYSELGLYDLRNRIYSPDMGRFLQADPSGFGGDTTNLYRYCRNNPLNSLDPDGLNVLFIEYRGVFVFGSGPLPGGGEWIVTSNIGANGESSTSSIAVAGVRTSLGGPLDVYAGVDKTVSDSGTSTSGITLVGGSRGPFEAGVLKTDTDIGGYGGFTFPGTRFATGMGFFFPNPFSTAGRIQRNINNGQVGDVNTPSDNPQSLDPNKVLNPPDLDSPFTGAGTTAAWFSLGGVDSSDVADFYGAGYVGNGGYGAGFNGYGGLGGVAGPAFSSSGTYVGTGYTASGYVAPGTSMAPPGSTVGSMGVGCPECGIRGPGGVP